MRNMEEMTTTIERVTNKLVLATRIVLGHNWHHNSVLSMFTVGIVDENKPGFRHSSIRHILTCLTYNKNAASRGVTGGFQVDKKCSSFTKCRLNLLANTTAHCKSGTFLFWSTLH